MIRRARRPVVLVAGVAVVVVAALAWSFGLVGDDETADPAVAGESSVAPVLDATTVAPSTVASPPATTTEVATTVPATTVPATTVPATTVPATTVPATTVPATTIPATTPTPTTPPADGPRVIVTGRVGPCKFGPSCLIADFSIVGFDTPQREFVCEFEDGGRYTFRFDGAGATDACATSATDGAIIVEVGGIRSEAVTR